LPIAAEPYCLTNLQDGHPGLRRLVHGYATAGTWIAVAKRMLNILGELASALPRDLRLRFKASGPAIRRMEQGDRYDLTAMRVVLYVHYAASGRVSEMVMRQVESLAEAGFAVVFITSASAVPEADWMAVKRVAALVVQRRNFGLDFGAWHDVAPEVRRRWAGLNELMLANDSVLGPIHALGPVIEALRTGGNGLFGLTESVQGGPHLQSYMLLARGPAAVRDLMQFVSGVTISHSKWLLIQFSELRFARWMRRRGHRVASLFGYDRLVRAALADAGEHYRLMATQPGLQGLAQMAPEEAVAMLYQWPVNPTRQFWHLLATRFGYPFLKTDLVLRGLSGQPDLDRWELVVPSDGPCSVEMLQAHLDGLRAR
jgi:hypothetical protein